MAGRHRGVGRLRPGLRAVLAGVVTVLVVALAVVAIRAATGPASAPADARSHPPTASPVSTTGRATTPDPTLTTSPDPSTDSPPRTSSATAPKTSSATSTGAARPAVLTPDGYWWGVDSTEPISTTTLDNVHGWYRHARPQFWGRYLRGDYGVTRSELAFARAQHIYVFVIVGDRNCSGCGGDVCGNDRTTTQAGSDAADAVRVARRLGLPAGTVLFKDIEQVSSCRGEPTRSYLLGWYHAVQHTVYRTGLYGNVHRQYYDFPVAYCAAAAADPSFAADVPLDMNEDEPLLGAPQGSTGPHNAPAYAPRSPKCAPKERTVIWQYGESVDNANLTDIDQARPDVHGLLAPDGGVT